MHLLLLPYQPVKVYRIDMDHPVEPDNTVRKVQNKFRLELTDEETVQYMQNLINVSSTTVIERIHKLAQFWRN